MGQTAAPDLRENKMQTMPVGKLLFTMALPLAISMLVQALYNVVDSIYVSQVSESAVTALSLAYPIQNLLIGFSTGVAVGVNSLMSRSLGGGDRECANRTAGNGIVLMLACVVLFMLFGFFAARPYFAMHSEVTETVEGGAAYISVCTVFCMGIFTEVLCERMLQATGKTIYTLFTQGLGAVINILLDPVFIFGKFGIPAMGIAGAAVATVIGQWIAAILAIIFNITANRDIQFRLRYLRPEKKVVKQILLVGVPSLVMIAIGSVMSFGMNQILLGFKDLGETAAGVFGVYFRLQSFFLMPVVGLNNAAISILAFNFGAKQPKRIMEALKKGIGAAIVIMMVGVLVFQLLPDQLMSIFKPSESFRTIGVSALRIISIHFPLAAVCILLGASFQALGDGIYSTVTSLCRQLFALLPAAYLLSLTGNVNAVWWSFPIAELVSLLASVLFFHRIYQQKIRPLL